MDKQVIERDIRKLEVLHDELAERATLSKTVEIYESTLPFISILFKMNATSDAFIMLCRRGNYIAASYMVRVVLEDALIFKACDLHPNGSLGVFRALSAGTELRNIQYGGRKYTYIELCQEFDKTDGKYMEALYRIYSSVLHFSGLHALANVTDVDDSSLTASVTIRSSSGSYSYASISPQDIGEWTLIMGSLLTYAYSRALGLTFG